MSRTATITTSITVSTAYGDDRVVDWRLAPPVLAGADVVLREVRTSDAESLAALLTTPEITRYISEPPATAEGFGRFIAASHRVRAAGQGICFAVTLRGCDTAIGILQVRRLSPDTGSLSDSSDVAEWGFAIGSAFWGTGVFRTGAQLMMHLAFDVIGVHRLEARACVANARGNAALKKVGAVQEGVLRRSFHSKGQYFDQALWTVLEEDWRRQAKVIWGGDIALN